MKRRKNPRHRRSEAEDDLVDQAVVVDEEEDEDEDEDEEKPELNPMQRKNQKKRKARRRVTMKMKMKMSSIVTMKLILEAMSKLPR